MKTKDLSVYIVLVALVLLSACKKEVSIENHFLPTIISDSIYLDKIYDLYDASLSDTNEIITFHYDALKRVVALNDSIYNGTVLDYVGALNYYYGAADTLPVKMIEISSSAASHDTTTTFISYDAAGRKVRDSILYNYNAPGSPTYYYKTIINYSFAPGKVFGETVFTQITLPSIVTVTRDTAILDSRGNVISNKKYELIGAAFSLVKTASFSFDSNRDPISLLTMHRSNFTFPNGGTQYIEYVGFNNVTSQHEVTPGQPDYDEASLYQYNSRGLPVKRTLLNGILNEVYFFKYKSL